MPSQWIEKRRRDQFYRLSKVKGYRSRASFKLLQANRSYRFIRRGQTVVDLGAAPGGWLQIASDAVGETGLVIGVDIQEIKSLDRRNVVTLVADLEDHSACSLIEERASGRVDVVLSDASPNLTGHWELDQARQIHLAELSLEIAIAILRRGGSFFVKAFDGVDLPILRSNLSDVFQTIRIVKPPASRADSSEIYLLGLSFRGGSQHRIRPNGVSESSGLKDT